MTRLSKLFLFSAACLAVACDSGFERPSRVDSLRVFGVKPQVRAVGEGDFSELASGSPGARVRLQLLGADGARPAGDPLRPLQIAWFSGCHNPPTRQFYACYPLLNALVSAMDRELVSPNNAAIPRDYFSVSANGDLSTVSAEAGTLFETNLPDDIVSSAPKSDRDPVHFGVSFSFFAACAGRLETRPQIHDHMPLACVDPDTGAELGIDDFVVGVATLFSYEGAQNQNPKLERLTFGGVDVDTPCQSDADCALPSEAPMGLSRRCGESGVCVLKVPRCAEGQRCPEYLVEPKLAAESSEKLPGGDNEVIWANFYANAGVFAVDTELLNDRALGPVKAPGSYYATPRADVAAADIWLTVDDQRSGADFRHFRVEVE
ncbi:MAG: hypothetical protein QM756_37220 [Polyangiaceae bacterium]